MKCGSCSYLNSSDRWWGKSYCSYRSSYVDEDDWACSAYSGGSGCGSRPPCSSCSYLNSSERSGYKCYCEYYNSYVDPDDTSSCSHYR